jgi:hypothetical protein
LQIRFMGIWKSIRCADANCALRVCLLLMNGRDERKVYRYDGHWYIPCEIAPLAAGPFFPVSRSSVEKYVKLPSEFLIHRYSDAVRMDQAGIAAAWVHGNSMIDKGIFDGNLAIFQRYEFGYLYHNNIVVIERVGEDEGFGAWALKKLVIKPHQSAHQNQDDEPISWNDPEVVLYSYNSCIYPYRLNSRGEYRVHGLFRRSLPFDEVIRVDSDFIRSLASR